MNGGEAGLEILFVAKETLGRVCDATVLIQELLSVVS